MPDITGASASDERPRLTYELDWNRLIYVDGEIDDTFVGRVAPQILRLKQDSSRPITVAIDSDGGYSRSLESLIGLLESPDQRGQRCPFYTAALNRARSAAATLLAFGDYSVAFKHSSILFHPSWNEPKEGLGAAAAAHLARSLQEGDEQLALRLAERILERKLLCFEDLSAGDDFANVKRDFPEVAESFRVKISHSLALLGCSDPDLFEVDFVGFATALWANLSAGLDDRLIDGALLDLVKVLEFREVMRHLSDGGTVPGVKEVRPGTAVRAKLARAFDFSRGLVGGTDASGDMSSDYRDARLTELSRIVAVYLQRMASTKKWGLGGGRFSEVEADYRLLERFDSYSAMESVGKVIWDRWHMLLSQEAIDKFNESPSDERAQLVESVLRPQSTFFWLFHLMTCRRLLSTENYLDPTEAQLLGLVEEVLGGGVVVSRGEIEARAALTSEGISEPASASSEPAAPSDVKDP